MSYPYKKKKRYRLKPFPILIAVITLTLLIAFIVFLATGGLEEPSSSGLANGNSSTISDKIVSEELGASVPTEPTEAEVEKMLQFVSSGDIVTEIEVGNAQSNPIWNLILVNRANKLKGDMDIEKTQFDTQWVDSRAAKAYQTMYEAAKKDGITLYLRSGYRSVSTQTTNYNADYQRNLNKGYSKEEATRLTEQYYARPGESEHHTGLAFDIITPEYHNDVYTLNEQFAETEAYTWLTQHCAEYGLILRFPEDKVDITKINYEPWHYRYVGVEHSEIIQKKGWCLEEYIANMRAAFSLTLEEDVREVFWNDTQSAAYDRANIEKQYIAFAQEYPKIIK